MEGGTGRPGEARLAGDDVVARAGITQKSVFCRVDPPSRTAPARRILCRAAGHTRQSRLLCLKHSVVSPVTFDVDVVEII